MKKTLAAVAVLGAFAGSALAADVQLYGIVDTGLGYNHVDVDNFDKGVNLGDPAFEGSGTYSASDSDSFSMKSGQASGSRFGFKGTEDLGNGLTVGFILENGILSDTGVDDGVAFNRESSLFVQGNFGRFAMGRLGSINNGQSSWAKIGMINAFGTSSWGGITAQVSNLMSTAGQWDNMIAYETPDFAGFKVFAQYGMGTKNENESSNDRYYAIGATYNNGPFAGYFAVDSINYQTAGLNTRLQDRDNVDDSLTVTLGGSYNFEVAKVYLGVQYFDEVKLNSLGGVTKDLIGSYDLNKAYNKYHETSYDALTVGNFLKVKGYGVSLTADAPVAGGKAMFGVGYVDAEAADSMTDMAKDVGYSADLDLKRYIVSVGYDYPFSKRTDVYAVASYSQDQLELKGAYSGDWDPSTYSLYVGLRHKF